MLQSGRHLKNIITKKLRAGGYNLEHHVQQYLSWVCDAYFDNFSDDDEISYHRLGLRHPIPVVTDYFLDGKKINAGDDDTFIEYCRVFHFAAKELIYFRRMGDFSSEENREMIYNIFSINDSGYMVSEKIYGENFITETNKLYRRMGVYYLYNKDKELIYIGRSVNICDRVKSSARERKGTYYFRYSIIENMADMFIYEMYLIATLRPSYNFDGSTFEYPTLNLPELDRSDYICLYDEGTQAEEVIEPKGESEVNGLLVREARTDSENVSILSN